MDHELSARRSAFRELASISMPVGTVEEMKRESVPDLESIAPQVLNQHVEQAPR
jgi:hypothetical protein